MPILLKTPFSDPLFLLLLELGGVITDLIEPILDL
jgi:hypothetical protein